MANLMLKSAFVAFLLTGDLGFGRVISTVITPHTRDWHQPSQAHRVECSLANVSGVQQTGKVILHQVRLSGTASTTSPSLNDTEVPFDSSEEINFNLANNETHTIVRNRGNSAILFPAAITVEVNENNGHLLGSCSIYWREGGPAGFTSIPINAGKAF